LDSPIQTEWAIHELQLAIRLDDSNPWAHRNLGACILQTGNACQAKHHCQQATVLNATDQQAWFGLGKACRVLGEAEEADKAFLRVINLGEYSEIAEMARHERSVLGQEAFRERGGSLGRPDAVMYCLSALQTFTDLPADQIRTTLLEFAMKGLQGFDVNDPEQKYRFKSLPGSFSGQAAVCHMYVAGQLIMPEHDFGFDVAEEYKTAQSLMPRK
jgi:tetratricopeptide (TPR) repeat protein